MRAIPTSVRLGLALALALAGAPASASAQCLAPRPGFELPGIAGTVNAAAWFDDGAGSGPRLYVGGAFQVAGVSLTSNIARWTGSYWEGVQGGTGGTVHALAVHDDGSGPALYVGGYFLGASGIEARNIVRWNGNAWSAVGPGFDRPVHALAVFDAGAGPRLYAGGNFQALVGGTPMLYVSTWDGAAWQPVGGGITSAIAGVEALHVHDDGTGSALYAAGYFDSAGGAPANQVARWNGAAWSALASGPATGGSVHALASFGGELYAGGAIFDVAGGSTAAIARWNGATWSAVGAGVLDVTQPSNTAVRALCAYDDGTGPALAVGGEFSRAGIDRAANVARWDGAAWTPLGGGATGIAPASPVSYAPQSVETIVHADVLAPGALVIGGSFAALDGAPRPAIGAWIGGAYASVGQGGGALGPVYELAAYDDGAGRALYAAGSFDGIGDVIAHGIARWDGARWHALGTGLQPGIGRALGTHDDGSGVALYVGGDFVSAGYVPAAKIARWDGGAWSSVGAGPVLAFDDRIDVVRSIDLGLGPRLFVAGGRTYPYGFVQVWDGASWTALPQVTSSVRDLAAFDDGGGARLFAATQQSVVRLDGASWTIVGSGGDVRSLLVWDDGSNSRLCAAGTFSALSGIALHGIGAFDGTTWSTVGTGLPAYARIYDVALFDDGTGGGASLWVGGQVLASAPYIGFAHLDGATWLPLPGGVTGPPSSLLPLVADIAVHDDGSGPSLFACGGFVSIDALGAGYLARIGRAGDPGCEPHTGATFCAGDGSASACPCGNVGHAQHGCENASATGGARLEALGQAHVAYDNVQLVTSDLPATTTGLVFQGTSAASGGAGSTFGDGLRCAGGTLIRLAVRTASAGRIVFGGAGSGDRPLSIAGSVPPTGGARTYQTWYRDAAPFCTSATWNLSNGLRIAWSE